MLARNVADQIRIVREQVLRVRIHVYREWSNVRFHAKRAEFLEKLAQIQLVLKLVAVLIVIDSIQY